VFIAGGDVDGFHKEVNIGTEGRNRTVNARHL